MDATNTEIEALRAECERLRRDRDALRTDLDANSRQTESLASAQLKLAANELSKDIRNDFFESVKRGLWIVALLGAVATAGGLITLSDILRSRIDAAVEGKHKEIDKLREGVIGALVDVKVRAEAANREVEALKSEVETTKKQFSQLKQQVEKEGAEAIASIRGVTVSVTSTVDASGKTSTKASATVRASDGAAATVTGTISTSSDWFGPLPPGLVGIAGSSFNQVGEDSLSSSQTPQGAFSFWFQKMLRDPSADRDKNQVVSLREAVEAVAPKLERQTPVIVGDDQQSSLFSLRVVQEANRPKRAIRAILVGINKYKSQPLELRGTINDVKGFATLLSDRSHLLATDVAVTLILDDKATLANIRASIEALEKVSSPQDVVIFYFSGHQSNILDPTSRSRAKALIPHDWEHVRFLLATDVVHWLSKVPAKQRIFVADV
jgi:hypothetical protein